MAAIARKLTLLYGAFQFPVAMQLAVDDRKGVSTNWAHKCNGGLHRVKQKKFCSGCNTELAQADITNVVQVAGQYVELTDAEIDSVAIPSNGALMVQEVADRATVSDPRLFTGKSYFLIPDPKDKFPANAYAHFVEAVRADDLILIARTAMYRREYTGLLRIDGNIIMMDLLRYPQELRPAPQIQLPNTVPAQVAMFRQINAANKVAQPKLDYPDNYGTGFDNLVQSKVAGLPAPTLPQQSVQQVAPDLMAMMQQSLALAEAKKAAAAAAAQAEPVKAEEKPAKAAKTAPKKGKKAKVA